MSIADAFVAEAVKNGVFTFDVEHDPDKKASDAVFTLWGVGFATGTEVMFIQNLDVAKDIIVQLFAHDEVEKVAFNGKYDLKCLKAVGWLPMEGPYPKNLCDPMVAINLLDDNRRPKQLGLKKYVKDTYDYDMMQFKEASVAGPTSPLFVHYAKDDAKWELRCWTDLKPRLIAEGLWKLFTKILMPVSGLFADLELHGLRWDTACARKTMLGFMKLRDQWEIEIVHELGGININSGDQLAKRLFEDLGYSTKGIAMTDTGRRFSVDAKAMDHLARLYPICKKIVHYRTANKMIGTYIEPLTRMAIDDPHGRIHPTVWIVSSTGRTRMEKPNFQNVPKYLDEDQFAGLKIRDSVVAAPGNKLIVADLSQVELRMCGHICQDPLFLKAYREWNCTACGESGSEEVQIMHVCPKCGAAENEEILKDPDAKGFWHGLDLHSMTAESVPIFKGDRQKGKKSNFAFIYCATGRRMNYEYPELSVDEWNLAIMQYMKRYVGVFQWHLRMEALLKSKGVTQDVFGRKRRIPRRTIHANYKHALNMFVNFGPQSSACGYIEIAGINMMNQWQDEGKWMKTVWPQNFVHDEWVFECVEQDVPAASATIVHWMENSVRFRVPMRTDLKVVDSWGKAA